MVRNRKAWRASWSLNFEVRPEGALHRWREDARELSIALVADERFVV